MNRMKCLILGGSYYVGRALVEALIKDGRFEIYIANRGTRKMDSPELTQIIIDRDEKSECEVLSRYDFDVVVDVSCYTPKQFENVRAFLRCDYYVFISTASVEYPGEDINYIEYAKDKRYCETLVENAYNKSLIVRPSYVVGEHDYTDRFMQNPENLLFFTKDSKNLIKRYIHVDILAKSIINMMFYREVGLAKFGYV